jgi:ketosteroid isomerase-like protein
MTTEAARFEDVSAAIATYNRRLAEAISRADITALEQLIASDHVTLAPDQAPVVGRDAAIAIMREALQRFHVTEAQHPTKTEIDLTLAYQWGDFTMTAVPKIGGEPVVRSGKYLRIYRRCTDGSWMMIVDSFSANHPDDGWEELISGG